MYDLPNHIKISDAQSHSDLDIHLSQNLKTYDIEYPPIKQENTAPIDIPHIIVTATFPSTNFRSLPIADLV